MDIKAYIGLSLALFTIGIIGVLVRRNAIIVFMCIELMLNSVNLLLVAFSKMHAISPVAKHLLHLPLMHKFLFSLLWLWPPQK